MRSTRFEAELIEGHKSVTVVIVPFDPEEKWGQKPLRLDRRRHGWLVTGTVGGVAFDGYIGERWGRFFIIIEPALRKAADVSLGDPLEVVVTPTTNERALERAREQCKVTTAPKKPRADAVELPVSRRRHS